MDAQEPNLAIDALMDPKRTKNQVNLAIVTLCAVDHQVNFDQLPIPDEDSSLV